MFRDERIQKSAQKNLPGGKNVIVSGRFLVKKVYFWGGMAEGAYLKSRHV